MYINLGDHVIFSTSLSTSKHSLNAKKKSIIKCKQTEQPEYLHPGHGRSAVECVLLYLNLHNSEACYNEVEVYTSSFL